MPFWQFFRMGWDGCALLLRPSRIPHRNSKNIFALGADEFLVMLEGKLERPHFLKVQSGKITVWDMCSLFSIFSSFFVHFWRTWNHHKLESIQRMKMFLQQMMWFISSCKQLLELITKNMAWIWYIAPLFYNSSVLYLSQFMSGVQKYNGRGVIVRMLFLY